MALKKAIELENGIMVNYHRIVSINKITNRENVIEVGSYINENKRQEEKEYYNNKETREVPMNVFIYTQYISKEYNEKETIEDAYSYLKTLDIYKDSENV